MENLLNVVVVGYGMAGRIHAKTHRNLIGSCRLAGIVERRRDYHSIIEKQFTGVDVYESLEQALSNIKDNVVVDLCVPAPQNIALAESAVAYGVQRIMLEKPIGWSLPMAMKLADILRDQEALYLDTYQFSLGVEQLKNLITHEHSEIDRVNITFNKNRVMESLNGRGFDENIPPNAWHIEGPHMVSIAIKVAGEILAIEEACLEDMTHNGQRLVDHGAAKAILRQSNGVRTLLSMDLCSDENVRHVEVYLKNQICLKLMLPPSKSTRLVSSIDKIEDGKVVDSYIVEDRPMEQCVSQSLDYFLTKNVYARTIDHGVQINQILQKLTEESIKQVSGYCSS